jgi:hypothetical protein
MIALATWQRFTVSTIMRRPSSSASSCASFAARRRPGPLGRPPALLAVLIALFQPDVGKIAAAALDRRT